jgi:hypothetical protein
LLESETRHAGCNGWETGKSFDSSSEGSMRVTKAVVAAIAAVLLIASFGRASAVKIKKTELPERFARPWIARPRAGTSSRAGGTWGSRRGVRGST